MRELEMSSPTPFSPLSFGPVHPGPLAPLLPPPTLGEEGPAPQTTLEQMLGYFCPQGRHELIGSHILGPIPWPCFSPEAVPAAHISS